ncbi:NEL-type E3 ubiquitin ligase domain-containing protein [Pseudomonas putida]|uniref:NEL-type E3 ubiquitin ligase domain-containing protein n=1 Tax=Pseudomonas putida TaxID=303 RepID=UPI0005BE763E|nr:DUF6543 domain-containing protein [Pseudomonas putida]
MSQTPYHHAQMARTLPYWSKALHIEHASRVLTRLRKDYRDTEGNNYAWYEQADEPTRQALQRAITQRDASSRALHAALGNLQGVTEFCAPLLQQQLNIDTPVTQAQYVYQATAVKQSVGLPVGPAVPHEVGEIVPKGDPQYRSLLEAALHNFEGPADTTRFSRLQRSRQHITPIEGVTRVGFIDQCRALNLGKRYQQHLDQIYNGDNKSELLSLAIDARRDEFRVQTRIAACKGHLGPAGAFALHGLCAENAAPTYEGRPLRCWQLQLFGIPIHELLFIAPAQNRKHDPVFLYNPADGDALREFASLGDARKYLRQQLLQDDYRKRFIALALQSQQAALSERLKRALYSNANKDDGTQLKPRNSIHLESIDKTLPNVPWAPLESSHLARLRADARRVAVPTEDVDARVRLQNIEYWLDLGMTVLNVAAMVVPCLNPIMLTIGAAQIMGSVFEGISAWEEGDNEAAAAQLESVLLNIVTVAAVGGGAVALKASGFVDAMQSVVKDGKDYLWNATLKDHASPVSIAEDLEPDAQGRYTVDGRHYIRIDGTVYALIHERGQWQIPHPQDSQAYRPIVRDNGAGAWRAAHEVPLEWDDLQLMRRLGPLSEGLNDAELQAALQCSGVQGAELRHTQVAAQHPPALLADALDRLQARNQGSLPEEAQPLARQFPGLPHRAIAQIMARTCASERLHLAQGRVPLRIAEEARALQAHARLGRALLGLYRPDLATADSEVLDAALQAEHPGLDARHRYEMAVADRPHAARLIGQQPIRPGYRSPMRLADGRLGYPLSGRLPWANTADRRLRALFPGLSTNERNALRGQLRQRGDFAAQLRALEIERNTLDDTLRDWASQGSEHQRNTRNVARDLFNAAWRRDHPDSLALEGLDIDTLPSLPARFDHITTLNIRAIGIRQMPADFFQSFPSLHTLRLAQCPELAFEGLFQALGSTPQLEILELGNNQLGNLTDNMRQRLAGLTRLRRLSLRRNNLQLVEADLQTLAPLPLEYLDLEYNHIALSDALAAQFTGLQHLRDLRLTNNPLGRAPDLTGLTRLANLQMSNCSLREWPRGLTSLMTQADLQLRHLSLSYNPIDQVPDLDQVLASPFADALRTTSRYGFWDFNENTLGTDSNRRLRTAGVEVHSDDELSDVSVDFWLVDASPEQAQLWDGLFEGDANRHLRDVVERVARSRQAERDQRGLTRQVWRLLEQAGRDEDLRTHLDTVAQDYPPTCGDAGTDAFSALELEAQVFRQLAEEAERPAYLFNFFRTLYRRDMVNALAERIQLARMARQARLLELERLPAQAQPARLDVPALDRLDDLSDNALLTGGVDLIEIRLALRQALAEPLEFPETSQGMLYRHEAMISARVASNVERAVLRLDDTAAERRAWVARQPSWQRYLAQRFASRFAALDERWYQGMQYLDYCLDAESEAVTSLNRTVLQTLTEVLPAPPLDASGQLHRMDLGSQAYDQASRRLNAGRDQQREALFETLTRAQDPNN